MPEACKHICIKNTRGETFWLRVLILLNRNAELLIRYANLKVDPKALALSERLYIYQPNPLFIRQRAELIICVNENVCARHQGYLALLKPRFFSSFFFFDFTGHIPSSLGVILRTTDKIVWANEFERKLLEDHTNLFFSKVAFLSLLI